MKFHFILVLLLSVCSVHAQRVKLSGTVSDPAGLPIELAVVQVKGTINGTLTDEKGKYSLSIAKNDSVTIVFTCLGYNRKEVSIEDPQEDRILNVQMRPQSYELETAVITANRIQTNTMGKINTGQGRLSVDATGGSIESYVMTAGAGVSSTNELSTQYSVRGGNYNENIVYVNGIEVYRPLLIRSGQQEGLSFINPDMTESVQFSSGGFDARYGDKMSSVLDVTYKKPEKLEGGIMGSMLGGSAYVGSASGKFTQITGVRYKRGTSLLNTLDTKGDYNPTALDLQTYLTYAFSKKLNMSFMGNYSDNIYDFNPGNRETSMGSINDQIQKFQVYYDGMEKDRFRTLFGAATLKYDLTEHADIALQVSGFQSREEATYDISGEYWISNVLEDESDNIGTGVFHQHARDYLNAKVFNATVLGAAGLNQNTIRWALGIQKEDIKDRINEWERRDSMGYSLPYNEEKLRVFSSLYSKNDIASNRFFGYIQDTYKFRTDAGLFSLTAGIRGSYWSYNGEFLFSPRASLGFVPGKNQNFTFRLATGIYYQSPFYKEFQVVNTNENGDGYITLNKDIESQRSIHFVWGGDYNFKMQDGRPFKFTTELYYKKLDRLVPYTVNNVRIWYYGENVSHGYVTGIDTKLFGKLIPKTDSWLGFSLMQAKQYIDGKKVSMPTDQLYNFTLYLSDYHPKYERLQGNLRIIWAQGLPFSAPGSEYKPDYQAPPYRRVDFGLSYLLWGEEDQTRTTSFWSNFKNIWVGVDLFNLFDIKNVSSYSWFTDVTGEQRAVPDKLTGRQLNIKLIAEF
ncbi:MAG: TonB-dependent receptor [Candidatus Symbiothrix sp.]|nr:TonB-dependent receptor [Candidatus Symbiothrix sp.]